jgi:hypothetical protein
MTKFEPDIKSWNDLLTVCPSPGSMVKIMGYNYNNFHNGESYKLLSFLDEAKTKLVLEGGIPGGWVDASHVERGVDYTNLRIISIAEVVSLVGLHNISKYISILNHKVFNRKIKGTNEDGDVIQVQGPVTFGMSCFYGGLPISLLSRQPHPGNLFKVIGTVIWSDVHLKTSNDPNPIIFEIKGNICKKFINEIIRDPTKALIHAVSSSGYKNPDFELLIAKTGTNAYGWINISFEYFKKDTINEKSKKEAIIDDSTDGNGGVLNAV